MITNSKSQLTKLIPFAKKKKRPRKEFIDISSKHAYPTGRKDRNGNDIYTNKYTEEQKQFMCVGLGQGMSPSEVADAVKEQYGIILNRPSVLFGQYRRIPKWKALIDKAREEYVPHLYEVSGSHKRIRLERHERIYEKAIVNHDLKHAIAATVEQRKEMEGDASNVSLTMNQFNILSDDELEFKKKQVMDRIKLISNQEIQNEQRTNQG